MKEKTEEAQLLLQDIQHTKRQMARTFSWKRRRDLLRHLEKVQRKLDKLRGKEERKQNERQKTKP